MASRRSYNREDALAAFFTNDDAGSVSADEEEDGLEQADDQDDEISIDDDSGVVLAQLQPVPEPSSSRNAFDLIQQYAGPTSLDDPFPPTRSVVRSATMTLESSSISIGPSPANTDHHEPQPTRCFTSKNKAIIWSSRATFPRPVNRVVVSSLKEQTRQLSTVTDFFLYLINKSMLAAIVQHPNKRLPAETPPLNEVDFLGSSVSCFSLA